MRDATTRALGAFAALALWSCGLRVVGSLEPSLADAGAGDGALVAEAGGGEDAPVAAGGGIPAKTALLFAKASSQYVNLTNIRIPADFTLEVWVKPASSGSEMMLVAEDRGTLETDDQFRLALTAAGTPYFVMTDDASSPHGLAMDAQHGPYVLSTAAPLPVGSWTHIAVSKTGNAFTLFVGGVQAARATTDDAAFSRNDDFDFRFGARMGNGGPADYFDGTLDEVRFFAVGRTAAEIQGDLSTELATSASSRANLVGYWRFDEGLGATVHDDLGVRNGTIENGASWVSSGAF